MTHAQNAILLVVPSPMLCFSAGGHFKADFYQFISLVHMV
jgi:hypothetical protein